jgi:antitoxin PrlF
MGLHALGIVGFIPPFAWNEGRRTTATVLIVKMDAKGRLTIPRQVREQLEIEPGDTFFLEVDGERGVLLFTKVENPLDILAEHALAEYRAGRTKSLRDFAAENAIALDGE